MAAPQVTPEELALRQRLKDDFEFYAPRCLKILDKAGRVAPFTLNESQRRLHEIAQRQLKEKGWVRLLVLKGRQQGISTYVEGRFYWKVSHKKGTRAYILTHEDKATANLFAMVRRYHEHCPPKVRPHTSNSSATELVFDILDSRYGLGTAKAKATGRGATPRFFHGCLGPETPIIDAATDSLRPMESFSVGDLVRTHTGASARVSFISKQQKPASKVTFRGLGCFALTSTDEHRFWTRDGWRELGDIAVGDTVGFPVARISDDGVVWAFCQQDVSRPQGGGTKQTGPDSVSPSYELGRVLGLYLAEGCILRQSKTRAPSAVCFSVHEREAERTVQWLSAVPGLTTSIRSAAVRDSKTVHVTAYGASFSVFVQRLCGSLDGKRLPQEWARCGEPFVRGLVHGYLAGDGHSSKADGDRRISATSVRSAITIGMRDAIASLGYGWACIDHKEAAVRHGRNEREAWVLRLCGGGVDRLTAELGWQMPRRKRTGSYGEIQVVDGYAWVPVRAIEQVGVVDVMDFEVDHDDHSYCTIHGATHNSEVAFWPMAQTHMAGILQGVPSGDEAMGTEIILESTANGVSGDGKWFYENCQAARSGDSDFELVFLPWFLEPGYRRKPPEGWEPSADEWEYASIYGLAADQLYWRNRKIQEMGGGDAGGRLFCQEYPANIDEAFLSEDDTALIRAESILEAMQRRPAEHAYGPLLIGVDPARYGDDKTAIVIRQGRRVHSVKRIGNASTMHVVGIIFRLIQELHPARVFVDEIGIGAGIVDRLRELGFGSITSGVNSASKALEHDKYYNRRAEMNVRMRDWLERDEPTLPSEKDAPTLLRDLAGIYYKYDSNGRYQLLLKEEIKKRLGWSPDAGDALALTFAAPVSMFAAETFEPGSAMTRQETALLAMESFEPPE